MSVSLSPPAATEERPSKGVGLVAVSAFSCLVVALQQTLVVPAVPRFPGLLDTTPAAVSWLVTATLLTGAVATPVIGRLSDLYGGRRMMLIAMAFVLAGSVIAPFGGITSLIAGRALQGVGTALVPVAMAQMRASLPRHRVSGALAMLSATLGVGGGIGVPLGGVILSALGWQAMFWFSALLAVASLVLIAVVMPANAPDDRGSFDLTGAILLSVALVALLLGVSQGASWGWTSAATIVAFIVGAAVLAGWVVFELRHRSPLVDLQTSTSRPLLLNNIASLLLGVMMFTNLLLTTRKLQGPVTEAGFGWSAAAAGLAMLPNAAAMFAVAPFSAKMAQRFGPRVVLGIGAAVAAAGYLLSIVASPAAALVIVWTTVIGIGVGIGYAALPMLIVRYAPAAEMGSANGVNALLRAIGTAIASTVVAAIGATLSVTVHGSAVPSATALGTIALVGAVLGAVTVGLARFARFRDETAYEGAA